MSKDETSVVYLKGSFRQTCGYCGCIFTVEVPGRIRNEGPENYCCPECNKRFPVKAADKPTVTLIHGRADGLKKKYSND